ncbi:M48 family metallopeptidase [Brassicibacter mesophilus]|uniref:M48 family metallopeptidase n=1 Tax=Brassicibacter mesophilus TaxID=745119 RepID=UPI003D2267A7
MGKYQVMYGDIVIEFILERKRVKNVNLNIKPNMEIWVSANKDVPIDFIKDFVKRKAQWILKNINYFKNVQPDYILEKKYISGESIKYLGKQYRLKVKESEEKEEVKYYQGYIYLYVKDKTNRKIKKELINRWLREKAEKKFKESLDRMYPQLGKYGLDKPKIEIRVMKARWGSCLEDKKVILLNFDLIKAPKLCIDYVVLHELIHFKFRNHDQKFYDFMTALMPDWQERKKILDEEIVRDL